MAQYSEKDNVVIHFKHFKMNKPQYHYVIHNFFLYYSNENPVGYLLNLHESNNSLK